MGFFKACVDREGAHLFCYFMNEKLSGLPTLYVTVLVS